MSMKSDLSDKVDLIMKGLKVAIVGVALVWIFTVLLDIEAYRVILTRAGISMIIAIIIYDYLWLEKHKNAGT